MRLVGLFRVLVFSFLRWVFPGLALRALQLQWRRGFLELQDLDVPASLTRFLPLRLPLRFVRLHVGRLRVQMSWRALRQLARWRRRPKSAPGVSREETWSLLSDLICIEVDDVGIILADDDDERLETPMERRLWKMFHGQLKMAKLQEYERLAARVLHLPMVPPPVPSSNRLLEESVDADGRETLPSIGVEERADGDSRTSPVVLPETSSAVARTANTLDTNEMRDTVSIVVDNNNNNHGDRYVASLNGAPAEQPQPNLRPDDQDAAWPSKRTNMPADICVSETQNRSQTDTEEKKIMESSVEAPATPQSSSSTLTGQHEVSASILSEAHRTASSTDVRASTERFEDVSDQVSEQVTGNATDDQALSTNANTFGHDTSAPLYEHEWDPSTFLEIFERSAWIQCFRKIRIRLHRIWIRIEADPDQSGGSACNASVSPWTMEVSLEEALLEPPDDTFRAQVHEHCALSFPNPNPEDGISHDTSLFLWRGHCLRGLRVRVTVDDERWLPLLTKTSGRDPWTRTAPLRSVDWSWLWQRLRNREMTSYLITDLVLFARMGINMSSLEDSAPSQIDGTISMQTQPVDATTLRLQVMIPRVGGNVTLATLVGLTRLTDQLGRWLWRTYLRQHHGVPEQRPDATSKCRRRSSSRSTAARAWWRYAVRCVLGMRQRSPWASSSSRLALPECSQGLRLQLLYFALYREQVYGEEAPAHLFQHYWPSIEHGWRKHLIPGTIRLQRDSTGGFADSTPNRFMPKTLGAQLQYLEEHMPLEQLLNARLLVHLHQRMKKQSRQESFGWRVWDWWKRRTQQTLQVSLQWFTSSIPIFDGGQRWYSTVRDRLLDRQRTRPRDELVGNAFSAPDQVDDSDAYTNIILGTDRRNNSTIISDPNSMNKTVENKDQDALNALRQCFQRAWMEAHAGGKRTDSLLFTETLVEALETSAPLDVDVQLSEAAWSLCRIHSLDLEDKRASISSSSDLDHSILFGIRLDGLSVRVRDPGTTIPLHVEILLRDLNIIPDMVQVKARPQSSFYANMPTADPTMALCLVLTIQKQVDRTQSSRSEDLDAHEVPTTSSSTSVETPDSNDATPASSLYLRLQPLQMRLQPEPLMALGTFVSRWRANIPVLLPEWTTGFVQRDPSVARAKAQEALRLHQRFTIDLYCEWIQIRYAERWLVDMERLSLVRTPGVTSRTSLGPATKKTPLTLSLASVQAQFQDTGSFTSSSSRAFISHSTCRVASMNEAAATSVLVLEPMPLVLEFYGQLDRGRSQTSPLEPSMHLLLAIRVPLALHAPPCVVLGLQHEWMHLQRIWERQGALDARRRQRLWHTPLEGNAVLEDVSVASLARELVLVQSFTRTDPQGHAEAVSESPTLRVLVLDAFGTVHLLDATTDWPRAPDEDAFMAPLWQLVDLQHPDERWSLLAKRGAHLALWQPDANQRESTASRATQEPRVGEAHVAASSVVFGLTLATRERAARWYREWCTYHGDVERLGWWRFLHPRYRSWFRTQSCLSKRLRKRSWETQRSRSARSMGSSCWEHSLGDNNNNNNNQVCLGTTRCSSGWPTLQVIPSIALWLEIDMPHGATIDLPIAAAAHRSEEAPPPTTTTPSRGTLDAHAAAGAAPLEGSMFDPNDWIRFQVSIAGLQLQLRTACAALPVDSVLMRLRSIAVRLYSELDANHRTFVGLPIVQIPSSTASCPVPSNDASKWLSSERLVANWQHYLENGGLDISEDASDPSASTCAELVVAFRHSWRENDPDQGFFMIPPVSLLANAAFIEPLLMLCTEMVDAKAGARTMDERTHAATALPPRAGQDGTPRDGHASRAPNEHRLLSLSSSSRWACIGRKLRRWRLATHFWVSLLERLSTDGRTSSGPDASATDFPATNTDRRETTRQGPRSSPSQGGEGVSACAPSHPGIPSRNDGHCTRPVGGNLLQNVPCCWWVHLSQALISLRATQEELGVFAELAVDHLDLACTNDGQPALELTMNIEQLTLRDLLSLRPDQDGAVRFRCGRQPDTDAVDPSKVAIAKSVPPATHAWSKGSASLPGVSPAERVAPSTCRQDRDRPETVYNARGSACLELKGLVQYASPSLPDAGARSPLHPEYDGQSSTSMESHQVAVALDMMVTAPEINYFHPFYALLVETILAWQAQACVIRSVPGWPSRDTTTEESPATCQVDGSRHRPGSSVEEHASLMQQASSTGAIQLKLHCLQPVLVFPSELDEAPLVLVMLEIARLKLDQQLAPSWSFSTPLPSSTTPNPSSGLSPVAHAEDAFEALVEQVSVLCLAQDPEHASVTFLEPVPLIEASIHWIRTSVCDRTAPEDESGFSRSVSVPQASKDLNDWSRTSTERMGVHESGHEDPNVFQVTLQAQATELECHLSPSVVASLELVLLTNLLRAYGERRIPVSTRQRIRWAAELCFDRCLLFADADDDDVAAEQDATGSLSNREHLGNRRAALRGREPPHVSVNDSSATSHPMDMSRSAARAAHREQQTSTVLPRTRTRQRTTSDPGREPLLETPVTEANHPRDAKTSSRTQPSRSWRASPSRGRPLFSQTDSRRPRPSSLSLADSEDVDLSTSVLLDCRGFRGIVSMSLPQGDTEAHFMLAECQLWSRRDQADQQTDVVDLRPTASASTLHGRNEEPRPSPKTTMQPAAVATHSNVPVSMNETRRASVQRSKSRWRQVRSGLVLSSGSLSLDMELHPGHPLAFQFQVQEPIQLVLCGPRAVAVLDVLTQMILVLGEITASLRPYLELHAISMESLFEIDGWDWSIQLPWIELLLLDQKTFGVDMQAGMGVQLEFHLSLRQTTNGRVQRLVAGVQELMLFRVWLQRQAAPNRWCWRGCVLYDIQDAPYFGSLMVVSAPTSGDDASVGTTSSQDVPTIQLVSEELRIRFGIDDLVLCQRAIDAMLNPLFQRMQLGQVRRAWQTRRLGSEAFRHRPSRSSRDAVESDAGPQQHFWRHRSGDRMSSSEWVASAPPHQEQRTPSQGRESQPYARLSTWFRSKLGRAFRIIERPGDAVGTRLDQGAPGDEQPWPRPEHARASSSSIPAEDDEPDRRSSAGNVLGEEASIGPGRNSLQDENQGPVLSTARTLPWQGSIAPIQCSLLDPFAEVPYALVSVALSVEELGITLEQDIGAVGVALHCRLGMHTFALDRFVWDTLAEPCSVWMHLRAQVGRPADAFTLGVALDVLESIEFTMSDQLIHAIAQVDQRIRRDFAVEQRQVGIHRQAYQRQRVWVRWTSLRAEPTTLRIHNATEMALRLETQLQLMPLEIAPGSFVELSIPAALPSTCCWYSENDQQHADVAFRARLSIAGSSSLWAPVWLNLSHYGHQVLRLRSQAANPSRTLKTKESLSSWLASLDLLMISVLRGDHVEISFHSPVLLRNRSGERLWLQVQVSAPGSLLLDSFSSSVSSDQELDMRWRSALQWYWTNLSAIDAPALSGKRRLAAAAARSADRPAGMEVWQRSAASEHDRVTDSKALVLETIVPKNGAISLPVGWLALNGQLRLAGMPTTRRGHARHGLVKPTGQLDEQHTHLDAGHDDACTMPAEPMACPVDADHVSLLTASLLEDAKTAAIATATDLPLTSSLPSIEGAALHRSSFYASLRGFKTRSGRCWLELTITPVVKLLNALPYSARLGLIQGDQVVAELFLASGQEASALHVDWMQPWRMEWSVSRPDDEYRCCAPLPFPSLALGTRLAEQGNGQAWHLDLLFVGQRTQLHRWWRLQLVRQEHSEESSARWLITLTANYWLLNFTDLPLTAMPLNHGLAAEDRRRWYRLWSRADTPHRQEQAGETAAGTSSWIHHPFNHDGETFEPQPREDVARAPMLESITGPAPQLGTEPSSQPMGIMAGRPMIAMNRASAWMMHLAGSEPEATLAASVRLAVMATRADDSDTDNDDHDRYWHGRRSASARRRTKGVMVQYQTLGKTRLVLDHWPLVVHRQPHWDLAGVTLVSLHPYILIHNASTYTMAFRALLSRAATEEMVINVGAETTALARVRPLRLPERTGRGRARRWLAHPVFSIAIPSHEHWFWSNSVPLHEESAFTLSMIVPELTLGEHLGAQRIKVLSRGRPSAPWWRRRNRTARRLPKMAAAEVVPAAPAASEPSSVGDRPRRSETSDQCSLNHRSRWAYLSDAFECILRIQISSNLLGQKIVTLTDELPTTPRFALLNRTPYVVVYRWASTAAATSWLRRGPHDLSFLVAPPRSRRMLSPGAGVNTARLQAMAFVSMEQALDWRHWRHGQEYDLMEPLIYDALPVHGKTSLPETFIYPQVDFVGTSTTQLVFMTMRATSISSVSAQGDHREQLGAFLRNDDGETLPLEVLLQVRVQRLAVSLVLRNAQQQFFEMLYGAASGVELFLHTYGLESALALNVESVQCDNALPFYVSPVMMISNQEPWISCAARWRQRAGGRHYYSVTLRVAELLIMLDDGLLWRLLVAARTFWSGLSQRRTGQQRTTPFLRNVLEPIDAPTLWLASSRAVSRNRLAHSYFHDVRVERLRIRLSFKSDRERASETSARTRQTLYTAGLVLTELDSALILVSAFHMRQVYAPLNEVIERMVQHVLWQSFLGSYNFIGGLSWLGDPAGWLHELREGTFDFFNEPITGLFESNEALWRGFRRGAFAQGQAITFALTQPIAQLAGSMARGLGTISLNRTYEIARARQDRTLGEPEDMFLGTAYGLLGAGTALGAALTGIFIEPVRGYRRHGVRGFLQGLVAGLWGWMPLLLASFLVLTQKLATGVRNQNRVDLRTRARMRDPRVLYATSDAPIPSYVAYLARGQRLLHHVQRGALAGESYLLHIEFDLEAVETRIPSATPWTGLGPGLSSWISGMEHPLRSFFRQNTRDASLTVAVPAAVILSRSQLVAVDGNGAFLWRCRLTRIERIQERRDRDGVRWFWLLSRRRGGGAHRHGGTVVMAWADLPTRAPSPSQSAFLRLVQLAMQRQASIERPTTAETDTEAPRRLPPLTSALDAGQVADMQARAAQMV